MKTKARLMVLSPGEPGGRGRNRLEVSNLGDRTRAFKLASRRHLTERPDWFYAAAEGRRESEGGGPPGQHVHPQNDAPSHFWAARSGGWTSAGQQLIRRRGRWPSGVRATGILR